MNFPANLADMDMTHLQSLIDNQVPESVQRSYKENIDARDLLNEILAFANVAGGWLVIGAVEWRVGNKKTGLIEKYVGVEHSADDWGQTLANQLHNVFPHLPAFGVGQVRLDNGKHVIVFHMPQSYEAPHSVTRDQKTNFYTRTEVSTHHMSHTQIRQAFLRSGLVEQEAEKFIDVTLEKIWYERGLVGEPGTPLVAFMLPFVSFIERPQLNIAEFDGYPESGTFGVGRYYFNHLGRIGLRNGRNYQVHFNQLYRDGRMVFSESMASDNGLINEGRFWNVYETLRSAAQTAMQFGLQGKAYCAAAILGAENQTVHFAQQVAGRPIQSQKVVTPLVEVDLTPEGLEDEVFRERLTLMLDVLCQSAGKEFFSWPDRGPGLRN